MQHRRALVPFLHSSSTPTPLMPQRLASCLLRDLSTLPGTLLLLLTVTCVTGFTQTVFQVGPDAVGDSF